MRLLASLRESIGNGREALNRLGAAAPWEGHTEHGAGHPLAEANGPQMPPAWLARYRENCADVPDPSERMTGMMFVSLIATPGLSAWMAESCHEEIAPVNIFAAVVASSRSEVIRLPSGACRLYMSDVPPATSGTY